MVFIAFAPSLPKSYPFLSFVPAIIYMSFWWFAPIQQKLTAFASILWCLGYFNIQALNFPIAPLALSHALIWWYQHHKLDSSRGDLHDLKDNAFMQPIRILWTLADEKSHFPDALNVYFHVFLTIFYFGIGMNFLLNPMDFEMVSGVRLHPPLNSGFRKISKSLNFSDSGLVSMSIIWIRLLSLNKMGRDNLQILEIASRRRLGKGKIWKKSGSIQT